MCVLPDWISHERAGLTLLGGGGWTGELMRHLPTVQGDTVMILWPMSGQQELCLQGGCQQWSFQLQQSCNGLSSCPEEAWPAWLCLL